MIPITDSSHFPGFSKASSLLSHYKSETGSPVDTPSQFLVNLSGATRWFQLLTRTGPL